MTAPSKVLIAIGTRPEIIKMAPIYYEFKNNGIEPLLLHTGQHMDMADSLYEFSGIIPDFRIELDRPTKDEKGQYDFCELSTLSHLLLKKISDIFATISNLSAVLVHGDTSSAFMAALAAYYKKCPVAHVEAGLRTHNKYSPFPEEANRTLIAQLAHWHFAPTELAKKNLLKENIAESQIHVVGNTIVEAAQLGIQKYDDHIVAAQNNPMDLTSKVAKHLVDKRMIMVTVHRHENQFGNIPNIAQAVLQLVEENPDLIVVWPVHPNPRVKSAVMAEFNNLPPDIADRIYLTQPLNYPVMLWILKNSWLVLTDSGGIQEEAAALSSPVMILRDTTERSEIIESGTGLLIGTNKEAIMNHVNALQQNPVQYKKMQTAKNPFGDGTTAKKICQILTKDLALGTGIAKFGITLFLMFVAGIHSASAQYLTDPQDRPAPASTMHYLVDPYEKPRRADNRVILHPPPPKDLSVWQAPVTSQLPAQANPIIPQPVATPLPEPLPEPTPQPQMHVEQQPASETGAYATSPGTPINKTGYLEAGGFFHSITNNFGNWSGTYVRGEFRSDDRNLWSGELDYLHEFRDGGVYGTIGNTHVFNSRWYSSVNVGASTGGFFLPRYRIDAAINRKWFQQGRFVTTLGVGTSEARDVHHDYGILLAAAYYFEAPWVLQGGIRFNFSDPGSVNSTSQFIAVTEGRVKEHFITLRYSWGNEAYQIVGPSRALSDFNSQVTSLEWREWLGEDWGFNALGEFYHNPNYDRTGLRLGLFKDF